MPFNSVQYALLLALTVTGFWALKPTGRRWLLLVVSYLFYGWADPRFTLLLFASCSVGFFSGRFLQHSDDAVARKRVLTLTIVANLVCLGFFKYFDFFVDNVGTLLDDIGLGAPDWSLRIALPVGVSFFTFQMISYVVDVYRREADATDSWLTFLIFGSFFPHLLAGPICRARRLIPQLGCDKPGPGKHQVSEGLELILLGLFMKVAVGDALAQVTGPVFAAFTDPAAADPGWGTLWAATLGSVIQFVIDFAGYSNIARGSAKLLAIELPYNFRQPLTRSNDFQDFWRREHMTLMAWFRDYVYRPLHRRQASPWWNHGVMLFLFALSGLWHGAAWVWVTWGLLVGSVLVIELEVKRRRSEKQRAQRRAAKALAASPKVDPVAPDVASLADPDAATLGEADHVSPEAGAPVAVKAPPAVTRKPAPSWSWLPARAYVFVLIALQVAWIRTGAVDSGLDLYGALLTPSTASVDADMLFLFLYGLVAMILVDNRQVQMEKREGTADPVTTLRAVGFGAMIVLIVLFSGAPPQPFVYFQF